MVEAGDDAYLMLNFAANFSLVMLISVMLIKKTCTLKIGMVMVELGGSDDVEITIKSQ